MYEGPFQVDLTQPDQSTSRKTRKHAKDQTEQTSESRRGVDYEISARERETGARRKRARKRESDTHR